MDWNPPNCCDMHNLAVSCNGNNHRYMRCSISIRVSRQSLPFVFVTIFKIELQFDLKILETATMPHLVEIPFIPIRNIRGFDPWLSAFLLHLHIILRTCENEILRDRISFDAIFNRGTGRACFNLFHKGGQSLSFANGWYFIFIRFRFSCTFR